MAGLDQVGGALEALGALGRRRRVPAARAALVMARATVIGLADLSDRLAVDRARDVAPHARPLLAVDERHGAEALSGIAACQGEEGLEALAMAELDAGRVFARRAIEIGRQRQMWIGGLRGAADPYDRPLDQMFDRHVGIGRHADEGGVRAVLEQAPHQIGEEVAMPSDRRIGATGDARRHLGELLTSPCRPRLGRVRVEFMPERSAPGVIACGRPSDRGAHGSLAHSSPRRRHSAGPRHSWREPAPRPQSSRR